MRRIILVELALRGRLHQVAVSQDQATVREYEQSGRIVIERDGFYCVYAS